MTDLSWLEAIYWREPLWLLLTLQPILLLSLRKLSNKRKLARYADPELQPWVSTRGDEKSLYRVFSRSTLYMISWLLLSIAMAGPRLLLEQPSAADIPELNIMIVLDVSRSMRTRDIEPDRLQRAKIEINELLQSVSRSRIGIVLYTARAHLLLPVTEDLQAMKYYLSLTDSIALPTYGSEAGTALVLAAKELEASTFEPTLPSAVLWLTDGDFSDNDSASIQRLQSAVQALNSAAIPLYILGLGSPEGDAIPDKDNSWVQHEGRPVISRMNERLLAELGETGHGRFITAQNDDSDWRYLYQQGMAAGSGSSDRINSNETLWHELYPWFLLPAILLLFICLLPYPLRPFFRQVLLPLCLIMTASLVQTDEVYATEQPYGQPSEMENGAYRSYQAEKFEQAADFYRQITAYRGRLGEGNSYYRLQQYSRAIKQFNQAVMLAENDQQRGRAIYNLANASFMTGDYEQAAVLYNDALLYHPANEAAISNLNLSLSLQQLIDEQIQQGLASRMGSGPRSARAEQGLEINSQGAMAFDNEEERKKLELPLPDLPPQALSTPLARGFAHLHLADKGKPSSTQNTVSRNRWHQDTTAARLRMRELDDLQPLLWKRLFEMEEGFPAPLEEPETLPGIWPW